ncbi:MAG TPA: response regulator [Thermoanaerobaculia bacterium]|nr:response regulator [Thermoanaerobaculia bacterium]
MMNRIEGGAAHDHGGLPAILLVDDEETILFAVRDYLSAAGWRVETASNVEQADECLRSGVFAAVVIDLRLSVDDEEGEGLELARRVRDQAPDTKVLVLTAYGSNRVQEEAARIGVHGFLQKPQPLTRLEQHLSSLISA